MKTVLTIQRLAISGWACKKLKLYPKAIKNVCLHMLKVIRRPYRKSNV